jgi:hypothetical protein
VAGGLSGTGRPTQFLTGEEARWTLKKQPLTGGLMLIGNAEWRHLLWVFRFLNLCLPNCGTIS